MDSSLTWSVALKTGDKLVLSISDVAFGGEGVGRVEDFVVFVPFVIDGEEVEVEITTVKQRFARAKPLRVLSASPHRVEPVCRHFGACGGCQYQHIAYAQQLAVKHKQVAGLFDRIGGFGGDRVEPVIPCPQPYGYRNRVMIRSQWNKPEQRLNIGFVRWDGRLVEDIDACSIAEPAINEQIRRVRANPPPRGGIKVVLRIPPDGWEVPPDSFFQNNFFQLPKLVETVRQVVREGGSRHLIDLYCGVGVFGIELADAVESFVGVEYDRQAIESARRNARARGCANGEFVAATVQQALPELLKRFSRERTAVVLDPPRKGVCPEVLQWLGRERPAQIIYVSCHPATMARDLNILCRESVFELVRVIPLDMFPQTQHVECVADVRCKAE
ncbi:MAG: class I SAM-dependent RNA methyltransferase [Verrucomicrobiota bacterium]|jgi:tRNA/tmRNA/rRNA uracil-C5-methylase (TrmA/RlmC/RlmD family)